MPQAESQIASSQWFNSGHFQFGHIPSPGSAIYTYTNPIWLDLQSCCQAVETETGTRECSGFLFCSSRPGTEEDVRTVTSSPAISYQLTGSDKLQNS